MRKNTLFLFVFICLISFKAFAVDHKAYYHYMMGETCFFDENFENAITEYIKAATYDPTSSHIRARIAAAYTQTGNADLAIENVKRAIELDNENIDAKNLYSDILIAQKNYSKALDICNEVLKIDPANARGIHCKVTMLIGINKNGEALKLLNSYVIQNPDDEKAYYGLGLIYFSMGKKSEAEKNYKKVLAISPNYIPAIMDLISIYEEKAKTEDDLIQELENLTQISSLKSIKDKIVRVCIDAAMNRKKTKYYDKAIELLTAMESDYPDNSNIKIQKAMILDEIGNTDDALLTLEDASRKFPKNERVFYYLATTYDKQNRKNDALKTMEQILQINPENPDALNYVGYSYLDKRTDLNKAKELISRALKILPDDPYITDSMGWLYYKMGDLKNAITHLEKALKLAQERKSFEPDIIDHLISVYKQMGLSDKIKQTYTDLLNSGVYNDKKTEIKTLFEKLNETPERKPASIEIEK